MELAHIFHAFLSLVFVIGLLLLTIFLFKYLEQKGLKSHFIKKLKSGSRINIIETKRLDAKNTIYLIQCDNKEYLLLANHGSGLLLHTQTVSSGSIVNE